MDLWKIGRLRQHILCSFENLYNVTQSFLFASQHTCFLPPHPHALTHSRNHAACLSLTQAWRWIPAVHMRSCFRMRFLHIKEVGITHGLTTHSFSRHLCDWYMNATLLACISFLIECFFYRILWLLYLVTCLRFHFTCFRLTSRTVSRGVSLRSCVKERVTFLY